MITKIAFILKMITTPVLSSSRRLGGGRWSYPEWSRKLRQRLPHPQHPRPRLQVSSANLLSDVSMRFSSFFVRNNSFSSSCIQTPHLHVWPVGGGVWTHYVWVWNCVQRRLRALLHDGKRSSCCVCCRVNATNGSCALCRTLTGRAPPWWSRGKDPNRGSPSRMSWPRMPQCPTPGPSRGPTSPLTWVRPSLMLRHPEGPVTQEQICFWKTHIFKKALDGGKEGGK